MKKTLSTNSKLDKASAQDWYQNGIRMDLNSLINKITKQNESLEKLNEKIDCLSEAISKILSKPGKT